MIEEIPHPRDTFDWVGPAAADEAFARGIARGRLHHAWLITGQAGVGKATFAYRAARRLLGATAAPRLGPLGSDPDHPASRQVRARAHPDLLVLQRQAEDGPQRKSIPVEEARTLAEFFSKSPAEATWRVAIVDAVDELNEFGANALLKTLEEPPAHGALLLICRSPGAITSTVRSRCMRLRIEPPSCQAALGWLAQHAGTNEEEGRSLLAMSGGAPGLAWRLGISGALEIDALARGLVRGLPARDESLSLKLADSFRGNAGAGRFQLVFDRLAAAVRERAHEAAATAVASANRWAEAWPMLVDLARQTEAVNLDRGDVFYTAVSRLSAIARSPGAC